MGISAWLIIIIPLIFIFYMAFYVKRYIRGAADYLVGGRVAGRYVIAIGDLESALGVITIVSMLEQNFRCGFSVGFWWGLGTPLSLFLALSGFCIYRYRQTKAISMGQFIEMRYSRPLRIFTAILRTVSEMTANCIGPAVVARFFLYFFNIPVYVDICGFKVSSFMLLIGSALLLCIAIIWHGGRLALIVTDCIQGLMCYPIFVIFSIYFLTEFSWFKEVAPLLGNRVPGESFLNPFDVQNLRDFNLFSIIVALTAKVLQRASWLDGTSGCGRNAHEQKMAGVLGGWRTGLSWVMMMLTSVSVLTYMWHPDFAPQAKEVRMILTDKVAEEVIRTPELRTKLHDGFSALPEQIRRPGIDKPLSQKDNPDTPYMDTAHRILKEVPKGNSLFQEFRSLYNQMMGVVGLKHMLPGILQGVFVLLMIMLMISTDDSRIFNSSSTIIQDIVMPLRKNPLTLKQHLGALKICTIGVALVFFFGSYLMSQMDYLAMYLSISTAIWLGAAGPIMVGGLYTKFGNSVGAWCAMIFGSGTSVFGFFAQRLWASDLYPFLARNGLAEPVGNFLTLVSKPFNPYIVWEMNPVKFPINSYELYFLAMLFGCLGYVGGSLLTYKEAYNLDRLFHKGIYGDGHDVAPSPWTWKNLYSKLIGITPEYTRTDRVIAWVVFSTSIILSFLILFVGVAVWNVFDPWPNSWWSMKFFLVNYPWCIFIGTISTLWFIPFGIRDLRQMFRDLAVRRENDLDDGRVEGNVSLADKAAFEAIEAKRKAEEKK